MSSEFNWQGYRIIAGTLKSGPAAQVYLGKRRATELRFSGDTVEAAIDAARAWVDARVAANVSARRAPHVGTAGEYADYFTANPLNLRESRMLAAHVEAKTLSVRELAVAAGWESEEVTSLHYGVLAHNVVDWLGLQIAKRGPDGSPVWRYAFAEEDGRGQRGEVLLRLHDEVIEGLRLSGALRQAPDR